MQIGKSYRPENPILFFWHHCPLIIFFAIIQHFLWAMMLLYDEEVEQVTALSALTPFIIVYRGVVLLLLVAILAASSIFVENRIYRTIMMIPQQFVLVVSAMGAMDAMIRGTFADGIAHPRSFIVADQIPAVLLCIFHTVAIIRSAQKKNWSL